MSDGRLAVTVSSLHFRNPILLAAGTAGYGVELEDVLDLDAIGGIVTKAVSLEPRSRAGDPFRCSLPVRDLAVQARRPLEGDVRPTLARGGDERSIEAEGFELSTAQRHLDARAREYPSPAADHPGIRIRHGRHHAPYSCPLHGIRAGWRPPRVIARLQGHVERGPTRCFPCAGERFDLCVGIPGPRVKPFADRSPRRHHHRPYHGIRRGEAGAALRELERASHPAEILGSKRRGRCHAGISPSTKLFGSKGWRSSICSPVPTNLMGTPSSR